MKALMNNKAGVLARVSNVKQKDGLSLDVQIDEGLLYAKKNNLDVLFSEKIIESAKSSKDRKKFNNFLQECRRRGIRHIIFYQIDREARNLTDSEAIEQLIRSGLFVIHYVKDNKVFDSNTSDTDFFMRDIQAATNRQFIRTLSGKVNDSMNKKAADGWYPSNHPPLGYVHHHPTNEFGQKQKRSTVITEDPDERFLKLVRREFELRAKGESFDAIFNRINLEGLLFNHYKLKSYSRSGIAKRLRSPFYRGQFLWKGELYKGKHPLIIPEETLKAVDATFGLKSAYGRRFGTDMGIFSGGWLKCSKCGCQIVYDPKQKRNRTTDEVKTFHYYHCSNGKKVHERQTNMREEKNWNAFEAAVDAINIPESFARKLAASLNENFEATKEATRRQIEDCRSELDQLDKKREIIIDIYAANDLEKDIYLQRMDGFKNERNRLLSKLEQFQNIINGAHQETAKTIIELAMTAKSLWNQRSPLERRQLLDLLLSNRSLNGASIEYDLKKPFKILSEMKEKQNWRSQGDLNPCILREREVS